MRQTHARLQPWPLLIRPRGSKEPWEQVFVQARSIFQAEAIARRYAFDVSLNSPGLREAKDGQASAPWVLERTPWPLRCEECGYSLSGLEIIQSHVECPECGRHQHLYNQRQSDDQSLTNQGCFKAVLWIFAIIGAIVSSLVALLVIASL